MLSSRFSIIQRLGPRLFGNTSCQHSPFRSNSSRISQHLIPKVPQSYYRPFSSIMDENDLNSNAKRKGDEEIVDAGAGPSEPKRSKVESDKKEHPINSDGENGAQGESSKVAEAEKEDKRSPKAKRIQAKQKGKGRRRGTRPEGDERNGESSDGPKTPRLPKRHCAILLGFCGAGYNGMQIQTNARSIENVLFDTLVKIGAVSQDNADNPAKSNLNRAARTDAGVHAAGNVVSMKIITAPAGVTNLVERINEELPQDIRIWGITRVQNSFQARASCDSRKYTYFFPSYLLIPPKPGSGLHRTFSQQTSSEPSTVHPFWDGISSESTHQEDLERKRRYRIDSAAVECLREISKKFLGSHNFHNFTVGREFSDRSNMRFMKNIEIADPVVYGDTEWIAVVIHGQSFMLHQRKMISALVLACRTGTPGQVIEEMYGPRMVFVPKMPALGLLLEYPIFETYNKKIGAVNGKLASDDPEYRPPIDFEQYRDKIDQFKTEYIYSNMRGAEDRLGVFDAWIRMVDCYAGNDLLYLNPKGIIPSDAVIKQGERRPNPFKEKRTFNATSFPQNKDIQSIDLEESDEEEETGKLDKAHLAETEG
ncbi:tRNA pseudouridine synthase TruA family protein [Abortiporus biennis]